MYCNNCTMPITEKDYTTCSQCGVPLHKGCASHCLTCGKDLCDSCFTANNYNCETCYRPEETFAVIRRSHIDLFMHCPYSLYLQLVKKVDVPNNAYAENGIQLHSILDMATNGIIKSKEEAINEYASRYSVSVIGITESSEISTKLYEAGLSTIDTYYNYSKDMPKPTYTEMNIIFELEPGLPKVSCTLDRIDVVNGEYHIVDWKTGRSKTGNGLITDIQIPLYCHAIYKQFGVYPKSFSLYYLAENKIKQYNLTSEEPLQYTVHSGKKDYVLDVNTHLENIKDVLRKIQNKQFGIPQDVKAYYCSNMCYFGKMQMCQGSQKEQWAALKNKYGKEE